MLTINGTAINVISVTYNPEDGSLEVDIDYSQNIQGDELDVTFDPSQINNAALLNQKVNKFKMAVVP